MTANGRWDLIQRLKVNESLFHYFIYIYIYIYISLIVNVLNLLSPLTVHKNFIRATFFARIFFLNIKFHLELTLPYISSILKILMFYLSSIYVPGD